MVSKKRLKALKSDFLSHITTNGGIQVFMFSLAILETEFESFFL